MGPAPVRRPWASTPASGPGASRSSATPGAAGSAGSWTSGWCWPSASRLRRGPADPAARRRHGRRHRGRPHARPGHRRRVRHPAWAGRSWTSTCGCRRPGGGPALGGPGRAAPPPGWRRRHPGHRAHPGRGGRRRGRPPSWSTPPAGCWPGPPTSRAAAGLVRVAGLSAAWPPGPRCSASAAAALALAGQLGTAVPGAIADVTVGPELVATLVQGGEVRFGRPTTLTAKLRVPADRCSTRWTSPAWASSTSDVPRKSVLTRREPCS